MLTDIKYLDSSRGLANQVIEIMIALWLQVNIMNGVGYKYPYQGMCFPSACSNEEIHQNSLEFSKKYQLPGSVLHSHWSRNVHAPCLALI